MSKKDSNGHVTVVVLLLKNKSKEVKCYVIFFADYTGNIQFSISEIFVTKAFYFILDIVSTIWLSIYQKAAEHIHFLCEKF